MFNILSKGSQYICASWCLISHRGWRG